MTTIPSAISLNAIRSSARYTPHLMQDSLEKIYRKLIVTLSDDPERQELQRTPERAAEALRFLTSGYKLDPERELANAIFPSDSDEMVLVKDIEFYSLCEHHLLPFFGRVHVAYIPNGSIIGLSKIPLIIDGYSHRLQIQERLTTQIATTLMEHLHARGVGVVIEARHLCVMMRGVRKQSPVIRTSSMLGMFRTNTSMRTEFLNLTS